MNFCAKSQVIFFFSKFRWDIFGDFQRLWHYGYHPKLNHFELLPFFHLYLTSSRMLLHFATSRLDKGFNLFFQDPGIVSASSFFIMRMILYLLAPLVIVLSITEASYSDNDPKGEIILNHAFLEIQARKFKFFHHNFFLFFVISAM